MPRIVCCIFRPAPPGETSIQEDSDPKCYPCMTKDKHVPSLLPIIDDPDSFCNTGRLLVKRRMVTFNLKPLAGKQALRCLFRYNVVMPNYPLLPLAARGKASRNRFAILPREYVLPSLPDELCLVKPSHGSAQATFETLARRIQILILNSAGGEKAALERTAVDWLYRAIRGNIRRGRVFEWQRMITERRADCLGYAKLFQVLGRNLGLDIGVAEVVIDNAGRYVPHFVNILRISDGTTRFVDAWYGSTDVLHRRIGLQVWHDNNWAIRDIESNELSSLADRRGLPPRCVYATTLFMLGNRHLENSFGSGDDTELDCALRYYDTAIALYPENPRFYFNRAITLENRGLSSDAESDYRCALADEDLLPRILATQHDDVVSLITLDDKGISARDQTLYLYHKGFITGSPTPMEEVASQNNLTVEEVEATIKGVEAAFSVS